MGLFNGLPKHSASDQTEPILRRHLDHDFTIFPMAESLGQLAQVKAIENEFGIHFPPEFVAHVCGRFPGVLIEAKESIWPRPKVLDVGPFWSFLYALHSYTPVS